jgi:hypothetical protein
VLGPVGFIEGLACDASMHGMGVKVSPRVPSRFLMPGKRHRLDVYDEESGATLSSVAEIRYVAGRSIGLRIIEPVNPEARPVPSAPAEPVALADLVGVGAGVGAATPR